MKRGDKEFEEMMQQFEKDIVKYPFTYGCTIEREAKNKDGAFIKGVYYTNGKINDLFEAYMLGYASRKCIDNL